MQDHFLEHLGGLYCDGVEEIFAFQDVCMYDLERLCVDFYRFVKDILGLVKWFGVLSGSSEAW